MSAIASRLLWLSSAAGSLVIHAGFALAALSLVPWAQIAPPRPESKISVAAMTTGFAADIAAPILAVPQVLTPTETVAAVEPIAALAPLDVAVAAAVPTPPLTAQPVASVASATVPAAQIAAAAPMAMAGPVDGVAAEPAEVPTAIATAPEQAIAVATVSPGTAALVAGPTLAPMLAETQAQASSVASLPAAPVSAAPVAVPMAPAATGAISLPTDTVATPVDALPTLAGTATGGAVARAPAQAGSAAPVARQAVAGSVATTGGVASQLAAPPQVAGAVSGSTVGGPVHPPVAASVRAGTAVAAPASTLAATVPQTTAIAALPAPAQPPAASALLLGLGEMSAFIDAHSDQACLAAVAQANMRGVAGLTGYGTAATLDDFTAEARAKFGAALPIDARVIAPGQCWLLDMLGAWRRYRDPAFDIVLSAEQVPSGGEVRASITPVGDNWLYVLLVDDAGKVTDLADNLIARDDAISLAAPVKAARGDQLQLLVAITSPTSLVSIDQHRGEPAPSFFAALQQELKTRQIRPQLAVAAFRVD